MTRQERIAALFPELAILDRLRAASSRIYPAEDVTSGTVTVDGIVFMVDSVEIIPGEPGCEETAVAYLSPLPPLPEP